MFCFQITTDHLTAPGEVGDTKGCWFGQHEQIDTKQAHSRLFHLYDDDGVLAFTGRMYWTGEPVPSELDSYEVLRWGAGQVGATRLTFHGKPAWTLA